ncbi:hypothetical protein PMAYCL1PPCAC_16506 [Pristionchus mayeri]|uniref:Elongation of very long chain fatty acids protein n=1 Tax=Pristionchus mayeri TaxID=1317129 RepID=A0AAN5CKU9_9BILA|nr:hypothetical protein PMAYCL1PPCAC_16506 [Pristionchus mayeri]
MATADPAAAASNASFPTPVSYPDVLFGEWDLQKTIHFMENTHLPVSIGATVGYIMMVFIVPNVMKKRKAFDLRWALTLWNMTLSIYSAISFYLLYPYVIQSYKKGGMIGTLCYNDDLYTNKVSGYVTWLFIMSKGPELMDTVFLLLRKRPVIFMHWYHHSVTFLLGQLFFTEFVPWARWGILINLMVHTVMYFYYGLRAYGVKTARWVSMAVTCTQITQFISGFYFAGRVAYMYVTNELNDCEAKVEKMGGGCVVIFTYLYLFCDYFYKTYVKNDSPTRPKKLEESVEEKELKKDQ